MRGQVYWKAVTDTARVLLTAAILSGAAVTLFAWRILQIDSEDSGRLIGELRLAQWAAVLLAGVGAVPLGLAIEEPIVMGNIDAALGVVFVGLAGMILQRDPREGLQLVALAFLLHALLDIAHRPGWLATDLAPRWYTAGCATYNVYIAGICYWAQRR
jgi:hypothetical protein